MFVKRLQYVREILAHPFNVNSKMRALIRYLKWNIGRRLVDNADYAIEVIPGCLVILSNSENYATLAYTCRLYDFDDMLFLLHYLQKGDCFGDFGANVGVYSALASTRGAKVLAVEPVPHTYGQLCRNFQLNNIQGLTVNRGLGKQKSTLSFTTNHGGMNRVASPGDKKTCVVSVLSADDLTQESGLYPSILKIDVEGFEHPLLEGAKELLATSVEALIIEMNESGGRYGFPDKKVDELLRNQCFSPYRYDSRTRGLSRLASPNRNGLNTIYIKDSAIEKVATKLKNALPVELPMGLL